MKLGILTYHRAHNYGAVLQCYALQETLKAMGHDVYIIDYRQPEIEKAYLYRKTYFDKKSFFRKNFFAGLRYLVHYLSENQQKYKQTYLLRKQIFEDFVNHYLNINKCYRKKIPQYFDGYIIGSDMLWSEECLYGKFDKIYWGVFPHKEDAKIIGYAISGTMTSLKDSLRCGVINNVSNFTSLSMREERFADFINTNTNGKCYVCVDPTLLADKSIWKNILNPKWSQHRYILTYYWRVPIQHQKMLTDNILRFAQDNNLEVVNIDINTIDRSVEDFVSMFKYAQMIITDSFHGTVFSIIFNRPFFAIHYNDVQDERYVNIIHKLEMNEYLVNPEFELYNINPNYEKTNNLLSKIKEDSYAFLANALK